MVYGWQHALSYAEAEARTTYMALLRLTTEKNSEKTSDSP